MKTLLYVAFRISSLFSSFTMWLSQFRQSSCPMSLFHFLYVAISSQCCVSESTLTGLIDGQTTHSSNTNSRNMTCNLDQPPRTLYTVCTIGRYVPLASIPLHHLSCRFFQRQNLSSNEQFLLWHIQTSPWLARVYSSKLF